MTTPSDPTQPPFRQQAALPPFAQGAPQSGPGAPATSGGLTPAASPPSRWGALLGVVSVVLMGIGLVFPYYSTVIVTGGGTRYSNEYWLLPIQRRVVSGESPETIVATMPLAVVGVLALVMVALAIAGWARRGFVTATVAMAMLATLCTPAISSFIYNVQNNNGLHDEVVLRPGGYLLTAAVLMSLVTIVVLLVTRPRT